MKTGVQNFAGWVIAFIVIAFVGFGDSVYLTASHYMGGVPTCAGVEGCDVVAMSEYAAWGGIPTALFGAIYYVAMLVAGFLWIDLRNDTILKLLPIVTIPAFLFSIWLVYVMGSVLNAWCLFCLISAGTSTLLMIISLYFYKQLSAKQPA